MLSLSSCFKGDEELQRQIIEMRAALEEKNKTVEKVQADLAELQAKAQKSPSATATPSTASSSSSGASAQELAKAKETIAELQKQLDAAKALASKAASSSGSASPAPFKIDMDAMADKLEEDLTHKAKQLRDLVQSQISAGRIDEVSLKSIEYPPQILTPFTSAITFNVLSANGTRLRLMFPVTADLGGSWKLPTPADVQTAYKAAQENPQGLAGNTTPQPSPTGITPQPGTGGGATQPQPQAQAQQPSAQPHAGGMRQIDATTFAFDWGDGATASATPRQPAQPQPQPQQPAQPSPAPQAQAQPSGGPSVITNFTPPGPGGAGTPSPGPAAPPAAPSTGGGAAAPAATPSAPPPVMPVVGDRVIRFD